MRTWLRFIIFCLCVLPTAVWAEIVESHFTVPVSATARDQSTVTRDVIVTVFQDNERKPSRFMLILHGRAGAASERAAYGRTRFAEIAREYAREGYAVFVPTRIGYGDTGGPDIEDTGRCDAKDYANGMAPATDAMLQVIAAIRKRPDIGNSSGVVMGQSVGGLLTVSLAARNAPRVVAYVNFAGGSGGDPKTRPGQPCGPEKLAQAYAHYGAKARTPVLWLYSANDLYWGADYPREWFAAFRKAGGRGRFVELPAFSSDGHRSFVGNRSAWSGAVEQFLKSPQ